MAAVSVPVTTSVVAHPLRRRSAPIAWKPPEGLDRHAWVSAGVRLGGLSRSSNWWVGDWLRYGTEKWGEKYVTAAKITGYDPHSLENMAYVASRFDISLRRENLSWSHHSLVAGLEVEERTYWLDLATERNLSVNDLRVELRAAKRALKPARQPTQALERRDEAVAGAVCPRCGFELGDDSRPSEPNEDVGS